MIGASSAMCRQVSPIESVQGVRLELDLDVKITRGFVAVSARALTGKTDLLAGQNSLRHLNVERALFRYQPPFGIDFGHAQCE